MNIRTPTFAVAPSTASAGMAAPESPSPGGGRFHQAVARSFKSPGLFCRHRKLQTVPISREDIRACGISNVLATGRAGPMARSAATPW